MRLQKYEEKLERAKKKVEKEVFCRISLKHLEFSGKVLMTYRRADSTPASIGICSISVRCSRGLEARAPILPHTITAHPRYRQVEEPPSAEPLVRWYERASEHKKK